MFHKEDVAIEDDWISNEWLPESLQRKLYTISISRQGAINTGGNTVVDKEVRLNSALEFLLYLPRALQIGIFSPMPSLWGGEASSPVTTFARKTFGVLTFFFYFCLLGFILGSIRHHKNVIVWIFVSFSLLGILVFAYTYPNIGTLLRFRYGFYMIIISFGAASIFEFFMQKSQA